MKKPNLFVLGAPKCGTTAFCDYLSQHPKICFSDPKEAKYFHTDFDKKHRYALTEDEYMKCFSHVTDEHEIVAEGTVWYLYSKEAIQNIKNYNPQAKFVVMLRNPADLAYSLHSQLLYGGDETERDFVKAWNLQAVRAEGKKIPIRCRDSKSLQYGEIASLGVQVQRLLEQVDSTKIYFVKFDDFVKNPESIYKDFLNFIDLKNNDVTEFNRVNENRVIKSRFLAEFMYFAKMIKNLIGIQKSFGLWKFLQPVISHKSKRVKLPDAFRNELKAYFFEDVQLLSSLLDMDLSDWY